MSTKEERKGFGVNQLKENDLSKVHPAWDLFTAAFHPADNGPESEYLTTAQVIERLNSIIDAGFISEPDVFKALTVANYKQLVPPPSGIFYWMMKPAQPVL